MRLAFGILWRFAPKDLFLACGLQVWSGCWRVCLSCEWRSFYPAVSAGMRMARNRPTNPLCSRARRIADDTGRSARRQRAHGPVPRCAPNASRISRAAQPGIASLSFASSPTIARGCPKSGTKVGYPPLYALSYGIPVTVEEIPQTLEAVWCTVEAVLETVEAVSRSLEAVPQSVEAVGSRFRSSAERLRKPLSPSTCGYIFLYLPSKASGTPQNYESVLWPLQAVRKPLQAVRKSLQA